MTRSCRTYVFLCVLGVSASALLAQPPALQVPQFHDADEADASEKIAVSASDKLKAKVGSESSYLVAVFPFGNSAGQATPSLAATSMNIQGELIEKLIPLANGKFFVVDTAGLARRFKDAGIDSSGVSTGDPVATGKVLKKIGVNAAIVGSMSGKTREQMVSEKKAGLVATIVYNDGTFDQLVGKFDPNVIPGPLVKPSGRFNVEIVSGGQVLPLSIADGKTDEMKAQYNNVLFLKLNENMKGKEYQIRVTNFGKPTIPYFGASPPSDPYVKADANRQFAAVVKIDGVNSIYHKNAAGEFAPVVLHPKNCRRWVLTPPGLAYYDATTSSGQKTVELRPIQQPADDGSRRTVPGFQTNSSTNAAFTFTSASASIAETVGVTNSVGLIEVHFYPQKLDEDIGTFAAPFGDGLGGTKPGTQTKFETKDVVVTWRDNPVEVWYIFYRYDIPESVDLKPFNPTTQP